MPQVIDVASGEKEIEFADLDGDGDMDMVVASSDKSNVSIFRGDGNGELVLAGNFSAGPNPTDIAIGDINNDGNLDIVVANHETLYLTLLLGDGTGAFDEAQNSPMEIGIAPHPHVVEIADIDRDGNADLIVDDRSGEGLYVVRGLGDGSFENEGVKIPVGGDPYLGFAAADVNGDGWLDMVTPNPQEVAVVTNTGSAKMVFKTSRAARLPSAFAVSLADMNGDGTTDLVAASEGGNSSAQVHLGNSAGTFGEETASYPMARGAKKITAGDLNGDGFQDAIVSSWASDVLVIVGSSESFDTVRLADARNPWGHAVGDLNGDGNDDFAIAEGATPTVSVFLSQP